MGTQGDQAALFASLRAHGATQLDDETYTRAASRLQGHTDASLETAASISGWVVQGQGAALHLGLAQAAEHRALDVRGGDHRALGRRLGHGLLPQALAGIGEHEPGPSSLATDSQSARDVSYNPQHHDRMKHVQRRHFFIRDMVETLELEVPFVRTADNVADMFTKPMRNANDFHKLRRIIMNEPT